MEDFSDTTKEALQALMSIKEELEEAGQDIRDLRNTVIEVVNRAQGPQDAWFAESVNWWGQ